MPKRRSYFGACSRAVSFCSAATSKAHRNCAKLIDDLRDLSEVEPIITIDQEGGRVSRLRLIGNEPPNAQQLRDKDDVDLIRRHGDITGRLLRVFGFNLDLCPVLDISFDDNADNSLRGRCYGKTVRASRAQCRRVQRRDARAGDRKLRKTFSRLLRARSRMRITNCRESIGRAKSWIRTNWPCFGIYR